MINFAIYKMATGIAERIILNTALVIVSEGLACHTNLKNRGRLLNAENLSFNVTSAISFYLPAEVK